MKIVTKFASSGKVFFESSGTGMPAHGIKLIEQSEEGEFGKSMIKAYVTNNLIIIYSFNQFVRPTEFVMSSDHDMVINTFVLHTEAGIWDSGYEPYLLSPDDVFTGQITLKGETKFTAPERVELLRIFMPPEYYQEVLGNYGETFSGIISIIKNRSESIFLHPLPVSPRMKILIKELLNYYNSNQSLLINFIRNKTLEIIHQQLELILARFDTQTTSAFSPSDKQKIIEAQRILKANFHNPPTVKQLALMLATNDFKLKTGFNIMFNTSIYQYVIALRMEKAIELMYEKNYSLEQVSEIIGYANLSHFTRIFKKIKGIAPSEFRAALKMK